MYFLRYFLPFSDCFISLSIILVGSICCLLLYLSQKMIWAAQEHQEASKKTQREEKQPKANSSVLCWTGFAVPCLQWNTKANTEALECTCLFTVRAAWEKGFGTSCMGVSSMNNLLSIPDIIAPASDTYSITSKCLKRCNYRYKRPE